MGRRDLRRRMQIPEAERARRKPGGRARRARRLDLLISLGLTRDAKPDGVVIWHGPLGPGQATIRREAGRWTVSVVATAIPGGLRVGREADVGGLRRLFQGQDVQTGDPEFDDAVRIDGGEVEVRALCTASVRRLLTRWVGLYRFEVSDRTVRMTLDDHAEQRVVKRMRTLRSLLRSLTRGPKEAQLRLLRNAGRDPLAAVRALSLLTLLEGPWAKLDARRRRRAVQAGAQHPKPEVRAAASGPLRQLLGTGELELARLPERALWVVLADGEADQRLAAARRLGDIGGVDSVPPLTERADAFFGSGALKTVARQAIEQIIERAGGLNSGGLSLADDQAGELSLLVDGDDPEFDDD